MYHIEICERMKNTIYRLQIPALVPEIFKFKKCVKYANEMTDDIIHSVNPILYQVHVKLYIKFIELYWPICSGDH